MAKSLIFESFVGENIGGEQGLPRHGSLPIQQNRVNPNPVNSSLRKN